MGNTNQSNARKSKNDEFYTQYEDIEKEVQNHKEKLKGKVIYLNADDYKESNFWKFFVAKYQEYNLAGLIATNFSEKGEALKASYNGLNITVEKLQGDGSYDSDECINILDKVDIVITNPPFSLFKDYLPFLINSKKEFLILGPYGSVIYKNIFPFIKEDLVHFGYTPRKVFDFIVSNDLEVINKNSSTINTDGQKLISVQSIIWFTNLEISKQAKKTKWTKKYYGNESHFENFDHFDAINVNKVKDIPIDYDGLIGAPITVLTSIDKSKWEIIDGISRYAILDSQDSNEKVRLAKSQMVSVNGVYKYSRILIKRKDLK